MLIRSIRAENFMRFERIQVTDLPREGIIGIEGPNESGKTSLGEALLFAFFGRTRLSLEMGLDRLIRWNADQMSVEVEFEAADGERLVLYREVDRAGTNYVKLIEAGSRRELATGNLAVDRALAGRLHYGYEEALDSFFLHQLDHVGQAKPRGEFLERMTGMHQIQAARRDCEEEIEALEREFAQFHKDLQRNRDQVSHIEESQTRLAGLNEELESCQQDLDGRQDDHRALEKDLESLRELNDQLDSDVRSLKKLGRGNPGELESGLRPVLERLESLEKASGQRAEFAKAQRKDIDQQIGRLKELGEFSRELGDLRGELEALQDEYRRQVDREADGHGLLFDELGQAHDTFNRNRRSCRVASFFAGCSLFLFTIFCALCVILMLDLPGQESLKEQLLSIDVDLERGTGIIGLIAGVCLVFFLTFLARRISLGGKGAPLRRKIHELDNRVEHVILDRERVRELLVKLREGKLDDFFEQGAELQAPGLADRLAAFRERHSRHGSSRPKKGFKKSLDGLSQGLRGLRSKLGDRIQGLETEIREGSQADRKKRSERDRIQNDIREIEALDQKLRDLEAAAERFQGETDRIQRRIEAHRLAGDLLEETARSILSSVRPAITRYVRDSLPRLTRDRYRDVRLGDDLTVELFNGETCDFLGLNEISGGTLETVELAIRLATSQAFIQLRAPQPQFVFLDEPFKMMDSARSIETLRVLPTLSPDLCQVFITRPEFSPEQREFFDATLRLETGAEELIASAGRRDSLPGATAGSEKVEKDENDEAVENSLPLEASESPEETPTTSAERA